MLLVCCAAATGLPQDLAAEVLRLTLGQPAPGWRLLGKLHYIARVHQRLASCQLCLRPVQGHCHSRCTASHTVMQSGHRPGSQGLVACSSCTTGCMHVGFACLQCLLTPNVPQPLARLRHWQVHCSLCSTAAAVAGAATAAELLAKQSGGNGSSSSSGKPRGISTGSAGLDALLGGSGVACGTVTEFCEWHSVALASCHKGLCCKTLQC